MSRRPGLVLAGTAVTSEEEIKAACTEIMRIADGFMTNKLLTASELEVFLSPTPVPVYASTSCVGPDSMQLVEGICGLDA